ncbi:GtrA family protein [Bartonella sp. LJL80]
MSVYKRYRSFIWFAISGSIAFVIDFVMLWIFSALGLNLWVARALAFAVAATFTWIFNSRISFKGRDAHLRKMKGWSTYIALAAIGGSVNYFTSMLILKNFTPTTPIVLLFAVAVGSCSGLFLNYATSHFFFFKK